MISDRYVDGGDNCKSCGRCCEQYHGRNYNGRDYLFASLWLNRSTPITSIRKEFAFDKKLAKLLVKVYKRRNKSKNNSCIMRIYRDGVYLCLLQARYGIERKPRVCQDYVCRYHRKVERENLKFDKVLAAKHY